MDKLLLIDGNSLINRAYYAFGGGGAMTWNGNPTNATYGFLNMFFKAVGDIKPKYIAVAFDVRAKTFRHKMYTQYKAHRKGMPDDLAVQFADLKDLLKIMGVTILECEGFEADDIIGTLSRKCRMLNAECRKMKYKFSFFSEVRYTWLYANSRNRYAFGRGGQLLSLAGDNG